ncbi:MAG TPA: hypothetical protein VJC07_00350 [Candidatus Nanoarchaeia archaeon]|nr:hypothetical protein [Candidatus Nanoarchaeia archaeon]
MGYHAPDFRKFIIGVADSLGADIRWGTGLAVLSRNSSEVAVMIMPSTTEDKIVLFLLVEPPNTKHIGKKGTLSIGECLSEDLLKKESDIRTRTLAMVQEYLV